MGQHQVSEVLALINMRIAGEDESTNAQFLIGLNLAQDLIRAADQRGPAARARAPDTGPKMRLYKAFHICKIAIFGLMANS